MIEDLSTRIPDRAVQIDEDGYFSMEGIRVADAIAGRDWLANLTIDKRGRAWTKMTGDFVFVEAFDEPYVALDLTQLEAGGWLVTMPYGHQEKFALETLTVDEWDRFHGRTERGVPFVLSRTAQARFFDLVDDYDDDGFTVGGVTVETKPWLQENTDVNNSGWWTNIYRTEEPRWDLGGPSPAIPQIVAQLKLQRARVLVLGAGAGHDAAWFAEQGHLVTAVDFSAEAIARGRAKYGHISNLTFLEADIFKLPESMNSNFDLIVEHTLYCAISPSRRADLVKIWKRVLVDHGHILGIFETRDKPFGPPYGGSEWEVRQRIKKGFRHLYWMRLKVTPPGREGQEFLVYAQKVPSF